MFVRLKSTLILTDSNKYVSQCVCKPIKSSVYQVYCHVQRSVLASLMNYEVFMRHDLMIQHQIRASREQWFVFYSNISQLLQVI